MVVKLDTSVLWKIKKVASFHFPLKNQQLLNYWVHFLNHSDWMPSPNSVLCKKHFIEKYIIHGIK